jgi:hypothetical protein
LFRPAAQRFKTVHAVCVNVDDWLKMYRNICLLDYLFQQYLVLGSHLPVPRSTEPGQQHMNFQ